MDSTFKDVFILELLEEFFLMTPLLENGVIELVLTESEQFKDMYTAFYDYSVQAYVIYKSMKWDLDTNGESVATEINEVERFDNISDLCKAILHIALSEQLVPRVGSIDELDEEEYDS
ncbi:MAG: hypothetical protein OXF06_00705 [Bacteroidetes bacterium]|nr:hypothetical protein [Bacteroidota bacterium]